MVGENKPVIMAPTYERTYLEHGWEFKQNDTDEDFVAVAQFPTVTHLDLLYHGRIPDPTIDSNRNQVQWVGEKTWLYRTTFVYAVDIPRNDLVFEGLDTFAMISLEGIEMLKADNMFLEYVSHVCVGDVLSRYSDGGCF